MEVDEVDRRVEDEGKLVVMVVLLLLLILYGE